MTWIDGMFIKIGWYYGQWIIGYRSNYILSYWNNVYLILIIIYVNIDQLVVFFNQLFFYNVFHYAEILYQKKYTENKKFWQTWFEKYETLKKQFRHAFWTIIQFTCFP